MVLELSAIGGVILACDVVEEAAKRAELQLREAVALVASQDGRFTVFTWSPCENRVHAHRVETLLL